MDAQRQELFVARFHLTGAGRREFDRETQIIAEADWLARLQPFDEATGPALRQLAPRLPVDVHSVSEEYWHPTAAAVGSLAWRRFTAGQRDDVWKLVPRYYRPSAAEEKAAGRNTRGRS
jgi:hypothetical protein